MIIAKLQGGMGNQMFQYAYGLMLAKRNKTELKMDLSMFPTYKYHSYSMQNLHISAPAATDEEIAQFVKYRPRKGRRNLLYNFVFADNKKYVEEPTFYFEPRLMEAKAPCLVDGYWQCEKYFLEIEDVIRKEFIISGPMNDYTRTMEQKIKAAEHPVILHVRRMDFANDPTMKVRHGTVSREYYEKAMQLVNGRVQNPSYFVFSDEPAWAKENIKTGFPTEYIGQGPEVNYLDLYLMTLCEHFILANSTFGWWGAWLSKHYRRNITTMPFRMTSTMDSHDLTCPGWSVLDDRS